MPHNQGKKGIFALDQLVSSFLVFVIVAALIALGLNMLGSIQVDVRCDSPSVFNSSSNSCMDPSNYSVRTGLSSSYNGTGSFIDGVSNISAKAPILGLLVGLLVLIAMLMSWRVV